MDTEHFTIHTDGGARGNPGPAAIGATIRRGHELIATVSRTIGRTTNNQAEYQAVVAALTIAADHGARIVDLFADSELIVKQLRGEYKVKNRDLAPWYIRAQTLVGRIGRVRFHTLPREDNAEADALVNQALDRASASE